MSSVAARWDGLGDAFYRKIDLYDMQWDVQDLSRLTVSAGSFGGPIALLHRPPHPGKPVIDIYNAAGRLIGNIKWNSGKLVCIGWSSTEDLVCCQDDGTLLIHDLFGAFKRNISMGHEAKEIKVLDAKTFVTDQDTGVAIMTSAFRIFAITSVSNPDEARIRKLAEVPGLKQRPIAWAIYHSDRQTKALVLTGSEVYAVDTAGQSRQVTLPVSGATDWRFIDLAISFNQKYLAMITQDGLLWVGELDFSRTHAVQQLPGLGPSLQLAFCGTGAVLVATDELHLVGKDDVLSLPAEDGPVAIVPELDGVRVISALRHDFFQRVPNSVEAIFKIGSMQPGSNLYEAFKEYNEKRNRADEYIRLILEQGTMRDAVDQCVSAAAQEFEAKGQKELLRAASFGKAFEMGIDPSSFVEVGQSLRILHNIRHDTHIGIPLSFSQLQHLTVAVLIDRLLLRRSYGLALKIATFLKLSESEGAARILAQWARFKVLQTHVPDDDIAKAIVEKVKDTSGISYADIAEEAFEKGRRNLAIRLLDHEPKASKQGQLLLKMNEERLALRKAMESGDTDFIHLVLLHMRSSPDMTLAKFLQILQNPEFAPAYHLFVQYCKERPERSRDLQDLFEFTQDLNPNTLAEWHLTEGLATDDLTSRLTHFRHAVDKFKLQNESHARFTEDQMKLLRFQKKLEDELNRGFLDLSLQETMSTLTSMGQHKHVETLRKDFKVPDRRFCWMKVTALAEVGDWPELEKFATSKVAAKFGGESFCDICLQYGRRDEAAKYISRVSKANKVSYCLKVGQLELAADLAAAAKNIEDLQQVLNHCGPGDAVLAGKVRLLRDQLVDRQR